MTPCEESHYVVIVDSIQDVEIYAKGAVDCPTCLARTIEKLDRAAALLRARAAEMPRE